MRSARYSARKAQRGFMATLVLMPIVVALVMAPLVAARTVQLAELKRLEFEVKQMLAPKGKRLPVPSVAADAQLEAEVEANAIRF